MKKITLNLNGSEKIWFTSDQHLGHNNIIKFCNRPFESVDLMDQTIIDNWNECISKNDIVFTLGDFMWHANTKKIVDIISKLNGTIYMILGNHDNEDMFNCIKSDRLKIISDITHLNIKINNEKIPIEICLSHYPLMTWSGRNRKVYNFHGHTHCRPDDSGYDKDLPYWKGYQIDVGVDNFNYKPVELQSILYLLENDKVKEDRKSIGNVNGNTKINTSKDGQLLKFELITYVEKLDKEIKSIYEFSDIQLGLYLDRYVYPEHPIIDMLEDHKRHIKQSGGDYLINVITPEQYNEIADILNNSI